MYTQRLHGWLPHEERERTDRALGEDVFLSIVLVPEGCPYAHALRPAFLGAHLRFADYRCEQEGGRCLN